MLSKIQKEHSEMDQKETKVMKILVNKDIEKVSTTNLSESYISPEKKLTTPHTAELCSQNEYLKSLLECPVCMDYALSPIWQCPNGHLICNKCRPKVRRCPICRVALGHIRNLAMERVMEVVKFPCVNEDEGCDVALHWQDKRKHDRNCSFAPCKCPTPNRVCSWTGNLQGLKQHLRTKHPSISLVKGHEITFQANSVSLGPPTDWLLLQECYGELFLLRLKKVKEEVVMYKAMVQMIATHYGASQYTFLIRLKAGHESLVFEGGVVSVLYDADQLFAYNLGCLVMTEQEAACFISNDSLDLCVETRRAVHVCKQ